MNFYERVYEKRWREQELRAVGRIWEVLVKVYFQSLMGEESRVLDIGCGFCHFLNYLKAKEKVGVDANPLARQFAADDVSVYHTEDLSLKNLSDDYFDRVFISNFLEHLDRPKDVIALLERVNHLLRPGGKVVILQPNFRLLGAAYFDFIDHKTILTDRSLDEALNITGFKVEKKVIRFLPYTTKSKFPRHPLLVRLYLWLRLLWPFLGKQSLFVALKPTSSHNAEGES